MYCPKCGNAIGEHAFFCQWCGEKIDLIERGAIIERIKYLKKLYEEEKNLSDLELCKYISRIYRGKEYLQHYDSFEDFGKNELGIDKSSMFMYKNVGDNLLDSNGAPLILRGSEWGIGKLNELYKLGIDFDIDTVNSLIKNGIIYPSMKLADLRKRVKNIKYLIADKLSLSE